MPRWIKWTLLAAIVTLPTLGWALTRHHAETSCPVTPDCPCEHAR